MSIGPRRTVARPHGGPDAFAEPDIVDLYVRVLRGRPRTTAEIPAIAPEGIDLSRALEALEAAGCIAVGREGLEIRDPRLAVPDLVRARLDERSDAWDAGGALAQELAPLARAWGEASRAGTAVPGRVLTGGAAVWWQTVLAEPGGVGVAVPRLDRVGAPDPDDLSERVAARGGGVRVLVPTTAMLPDAGGDVVAALAEAGAEVRLARRIPGWLGVGASAVLDLRWCDVTVSAILQTRDASIVAALTWIFDDGWSRGIPLDGLDVFTLLGAGHDDAEIAELLDTSVRTVQRRIADAMDAVGARSRFELGAAWARTPEIVARHRA